MVIKMPFLTRAKVLSWPFLVVALLSGARGGAGNGLGGSRGWLTAPPAPARLIATAWNSRVSLTWDLSPGATSYHVKRSTTRGGPYTLIGTPTAPKYNDSGLTNGKRYFYVVSAANPSAESANSAEVWASPNAPPAVPTEVTASPGNAQVILTWNASVGATLYHVKRSTTNGGPYTQIGAPTAAKYTDTGVTNGTPYFYVVSAVNAGGESANSAQVSATPVAPPATPTGLTPSPGNAQVALSWNASTGATLYHVKRSTTNGGPYTQVGAPTAPKYTDTGLTNGTPYVYVVSAVNAGGESANSAQVSATPNVVPAAPTGLSASPGNAQVVLSWNASAGATSYHVKRSTTSGGSYATVDSPTVTSYTDAGLNNGTPYFYVVSAVNSAGESANSTQATATPEAAISEVQVTVNTLANRHPISRYVYGGAYPQDAPHVTDSGMTVVRWGGNATSRYNWQTQTYNAANDWYFSDYLISGFNNGGDSDSAQWIRDVLAAGSNPLMTMVMLDWVSNAPNAEADGRFHSFSVAKYGAQCASDPYDSDAGDGLETDCSTPITGNNPHDANVPLLDTSSSPCPPAANGNCTGSLYRNDWTTALASAFNTSSSAQHFYNMDNEVDIWGGTHRDVHPNPTGYKELRDTYLAEARNLKSWDPAAVRLGPVSCCWWFYWNGANGNDKAAHGQIDQLPWFLNEVHWRDQIDNTRSLDVFDVHAYPDGPDTSGFTQAQNQALTLRIYRDYWDPTYNSEPGSDIAQIWTTSIQPQRTIPFRIPRLRAMINMIYPNTPLSMTEWSAAFAGESNFSTALADADAYGIIGRERVYLASRWTAPNPTNPNYQALKLYQNYDGNHSTFGTTSISATHNADPNLFSVYAALSPAGAPLTLVVINKDPVNAAQVTFALNHFSASAFTSYRLSQALPNSIVASTSQPWSATQTFPSYSATLLVVTGSSTATAAEWDLNPDTIQVPAGGSVNLAPKLLSGSSVTLTGASFDSGGGTISITEAQVTPSREGAISVSTAATETPGFYHFTVTGQDSSGVTQSQGGWIVIGNPSATLTNNATQASGAAGQTVTVSVTLNPGQSVGSPACGPQVPPCPVLPPSFTAGASVLFTVNAGSLLGGVYPPTSTSSTTQQIAVVDSNGNATVKLTLPATSGDKVNVTAQGPYALGHPVLALTVTVQ